MDGLRRERGRCTNASASGAIVRVVRSSLRANVPAPNDAQPQRARDAALAELRMLVTAVEASQRDARLARTLTASWRQLVPWGRRFLGSATTPLACVATLLPAILWGRTAALIVAGLEVVGVLALRSRDLGRRSWRRWLYGVAIAAFFVMIS